MLGITAKKTGQKHGTAVKNEGSRVTSARISIQQKTFSKNRSHRFFYAVKISNMGSLVLALCTVWY